MLRTAPAPTARPLSDADGAAALRRSNDRLQRAKDRRVCDAALSEAAGGLGPPDAAPSEAAESLGPPVQQSVAQVTQSLHLHGD